MITGELAETLEDRWVRAGDYQLHLLASHPAVKGTLPIVFLAGFVVGGHSAVPLTAELARHYETYAPDLPGYGESTRPPHTLDQAEQADVIAAMLDTLAIGSVGLLANSFSAQIAVELAVRHPLRVRRMVLMAAGVDRRARTPFQQLFRFYKNSKHEDAIVPGMVRDYLKVGALRIVQTARLALRYRMEDRLPLVQAPTLVVHAANDEIIPRAWSQEIAGLLPRGRLVEVPGFAHGIERVAVAALTPVIRAFLDQAPEDQ